MGFLVVQHIDSALIGDIVQRALEEDLGGRGDITSASIFAEHDNALAQIRSKESGKLSGSYLVEPIFSKIDRAISVEFRASDGEGLGPGTEIAKISGPIRGILAGERVILNFLQRLSGIATQTAQLVNAISHTKARVLDTRKTTPTLRLLEKKAVRDGGGYNHRSGLYDMVLIKDTHIKAAGGITAAISKVRRRISVDDGTKIEVEVQSVEEFLQALSELPDRIMLDNMPLEGMATCVNHVRTRRLSVELEASGNVTRENIAAIAETGVDFISVGSVTHSAAALDIHLVIL